MTEQVKIAVVGASALRGKELTEVLEETKFGSAEIALLDEDDALGQLETVGDEIALVARVEAESFQGMDYVFFAGTQEQTRQHWQNAAASHASIVDMTGALEGEDGVLVAAPWVRDAIDNPAIPSVDLYTPALVPAHIAATALALVLARLQDAGAIRGAWATVHEPASEHGRAAVDELHQQTVTLLNFQSMPKEIYDTQVAFNIAPAVGESSQIDIAAIEDRIRRHYGLLSAGRLPEVAVQLLQVPAFHGYGISLGVEFEVAATQEHVEAVLAGEHVDVVLGENDPPSNLSCAGQEDFLVRVRQAGATEARATRWWIWMSFDNLKMAALGALSCASELRRLRPRGKVQ